MALVGFLGIGIAAIWFVIAHSYLDYSGTDQAEWRREVNALARRRRPRNRMKYAKLWK
ncbi:MAG: hypothetical protein J6S60_08470 [Oscillospiraceae bacterium]|nr:hypothetical protein [Oscillospiraceae bacterium]